MKIITNRRIITRRNDNLYSNFGDAIAEKLAEKYGDEGVQKTPATSEDKKMVL